MRFIFLGIVLENYSGVDLPWWFYVCVVIAAMISDSLLKDNINKSINKSLIKAINYRR